MCVQNVGNNVIYRPIWTVCELCVLCVKFSLRNLTETCFGVCGLTHRLNRPEIDWCCECINRLIWGYHVSCVVTFVTKNRSVGIDVFIEGSCVYTSTRGLEDGPIRPCDVLNKVMLVNKAPVNSHGFQRGGDNGQVRGTRTSVDNRPIRVAGRFGCLYSPVQGADWLDVLSVVVTKTAVSRRSCWSSDSDGRESCRDDWGDGD